MARLAHDNDHDPEPTEVERRDAMRALANPDRLREVFGAALYQVEHDAQQQAQVVCTLAARMLRCRHAAVNLLTDDTQITVATNDPDLTPAYRPIPQAVCQHVVRLGTPYVVVDATENRLLNGVEAVATGELRCYLGAPIVLGNQVVGALCVYGEDSRQWTLDEVTLLQAFAELLA